jgi:hypothetical protein
VAEDQIGNRDGGFVEGKISWASDATFETVLEFAEGDGVLMPAWSGGAFPGKGTVSVWVRLQLKSPELEQETRNRGIFDNWSSSRNQLLIRRPNTDTAPISLRAGFQSATGTVDSLEVEVPNETWMHVAIGWNTETNLGVFHVDGKSSPLESSGEPSWTPNEQEFLFGKLLIGRLAHARLYDRLLSHDELVEVGKLQMP